MLERAIMRTAWLLNALGGGAGRGGASEAAVCIGEAKATRGCCCAETHVAAHCAAGALAHGTYARIAIRNARLNIFIGRFRHNQP